MITAVTKWGNSQGVRIPRDILDIANISNGDSVEITAEKNSIIIRKHHRRKSIQELFEGFDGVYVSEEVDWGSPVGDEIW
ncbi:MAG: AbrB/MazE/SpoVT family DNA-binding domain-containing protein [Synergistaceae bacterium]|jgi:antitoxin MazE|nr:AbrB/MazE/SpoVT family DNA-binding domain-containing protein [Synergistaceae bacterium]